MLSFIFLNSHSQVSDPGTKGPLVVEKYNYNLIKLSVTSESMCTNYWLTACSSLARKKCG